MATGCLPTKGCVPVRLPAPPPHLLDPLIQKRVFPSVPEVNAPHKGREKEQEDEQNCYQDGFMIVMLHGAAVHAASQARLLTVWRSPTCIAVAVLVAVANPVAVAPGNALFQLKKGGILAPAVFANHSISTFCPRHHQPRVGQVFFIILGSVHVGAPALHLSPIEADGSVNGDSVGPLGFLGRALALDLATHGISLVTLHVAPLAVFATVAIGVASHVHILETGSWGWPGSWSPELDTLLVVGHAHAVVAVCLPISTGRAIQQVHIGWAVG